MKECMGNFKLSPTVLECNKIVHPAQITCVVVISGISGAFVGDLAVIWGTARMNYFIAFQYSLGII